VKVDVGDEPGIESPGQERAFDLQESRLTDLEEEIDALNKASGRLLIQRRKLHARIKSIVKSLLRSGLDIPPDRVEAMEREIAAAAENALNLEVWLTEYRQITETLTASNRDFYRSAAAAMERAGALAAECDRLHGLVEALDAERAALAARLDVEQAALEQLRQHDGERAQQLAALERDLAAARTSAATPVSSGVEEELRARLKEMEAKHQALAVEREKDRRNHAIQVASLTKQITQLRERYDERVSETVARGPAAPGGEAPRRAKEDAERAKALRAGRAAPPPEPAPTAAPAPAPAEAAAAPPPRHEIILLDDDKLGPEIGAQLSGAGYPVTSLVARTGLAAQLPAPSIAAMALNLALAETWTVLRAVRTNPAFEGVVLVAYAAIAGTPNAFWFGPIEVVMQPLSREHLAPLLQRMTTRLKQTLLISHDAAAAEGIAKVLSKLRVTVAVARDRAQTLDAIKGVYPHVALVHPAASPVDVFRAVAALRDVSLFRRIPLVFVLDQQPPAREETLYSAAVRTILRFGDAKSEELAPALAQVFSPRLRRSA
jgi:CheY-like chemotaxis protein